MTTPRLKVDWTVPVWGVLGLLAQGVFVIWWGATLQSDVNDLKDRMSKVEQTSELVARLDERTSAMDKTLDRIERSVSEEG